MSVMALTSCHDQVDQVSGSYSYKISGKAVIDGDTVVLSDETGAMEIVRLSADSTLLTFNALLGPAYTAKAKIEGKDIRIMPYERTVNHQLKDYFVTAQGSGTFYDKTIVVTLQYADTTADLKADKLTMLCKKN